MKNNAFNSRLIFVVRVLLIFVFIYAACSKLADLQTFSHQISLSPLIPEGLQGAVAILIPLSEIFISILLCFDITSRSGLYAGYFMMLLFTLYIIFLMGYSTFIPCSCGGILGKMSWKYHLLFNISLLIFSVIACYKAEESAQPVRRSAQS